MGHMRNLEHTQNVNQPVFNIDPSSVAGFWFVGIDKEYISKMIYSVNEHPEEELNLRPPITIFTSHI